MALNWIEVKKEVCHNRKKETDTVGVNIVIYRVSETGKKEELAWLMHPLYINKKFNRGKFTNV